MTAPCSAVPPAMPLVVIGGYLGSGKTTLLNHLLRHAAGRRVAVLVNDFGSISIDADLIEGASDDVLALAGGCICCSFGSDLFGALQRLTQRTPRPDIVLLECSGVGLPAHVASSAALVPGIQAEGVVVLVDATHAHAQAHDRYTGDTLREQWRQADILVLNHLDGLCAREAADVAQWLAAQTPGVPQIRCAHAQVDPDMVLGLRWAERRPPRNRKLLDGAGRYQAPTAAAVHPVHHWSRELDGPCDARALAQQLIDEAEGRLLRAKGVVQGLDGQWWVLHVVGRRVHVARRAAGPTPHAGTIVCIELLPEPDAPVGRHQRTTRGSAEEAPVWTHKDSPHH